MHETHKGLDHRTELTTPREKTRVCIIIVVTCKSAFAMLHADALAIPHCRMAARQRLRTGGGPPFMTWQALSQAPSQALPSLRLRRRAPRTCRTEGLSKRDRPELDLV